METTPVLPRSFPSIDSSSLKTYYQDDFVKITDKFVRTYGTTFFLNQVVSVRPVRIPPPYLRNILVFGFICVVIAAPLAALLMPTNQTLSLVVLVLGIAIGLIIGVLVSKPQYLVRISLSSGEISHIQVSNDNGARQIASMVIKSQVENI